MTETPTLTTYDILSIDGRPALARAVRIAAETNRDIELVDESRRVERAADWLASRRRWGDADGPEYQWPTWYERRCYGMRTGYDAPGAVRYDITPYGPTYFDGLFDAAAALGVSLTAMADAVDAVDPYKLAVARNFRRVR